MHSKKVIIITVNIFSAGFNKQLADKPVRRKKRSTGYNCCVPDCHNFSGNYVVRQKANLPKVSFHGFPDIQSSKGKRWIKLIRRDIGGDFTVTEHTKICSDHFASSDYYLSKSGKRWLLSSTADPSYFPWTKTTTQMSLTSQKALQVLPADLPQQSTYPNRNPVTHMMSLHNTSHIEIPENTPDVAENIHSMSLYNTSDIEVTENTPDIAENLDIPVSESTHRQIVEQKSVEALQNEVHRLKVQLAEAESKLSRSLLRLENVRHNQVLLKFYTGFSSYDTLEAFYEELLEEDALLMRQWSGKQSDCDYSDVKAGPPCKLPLKEQ